jgi:hypothetical protein
VWEPFVGAMRAHTSNADVQLAGCAALDNLLKLALDETHLGPRVLEEGGVGAIVGAMRAHTSNADVQLAGCAALENTLRGNLLVDRKELTKEVTAAVFEAMENHGDDHKVISAGVEVLSEFEDVEDGISAVLGAMEANRSNSDLQEKALKVLCCVYMPKEEEDDAILGLEAATRRISAVVEAMRAPWPEHEIMDLQDFGCDILLSLAEGNNGNRIRVVEAGGLEAVIEALENNDLEWRNDWKDLAVLLNPDDDTQSRAGEAGAVEAVVKMIRRV